MYATSMNQWTKPGDYPIQTATAAEWPERPRELQCQSAPVMSQARMLSLLGGDSAAYDVAASDHQTLLPDADRGSDKLKAFKLFISDVLKNHFKVFVAVCDVFCVLTFTTVILVANAWNCEDVLAGSDQDLGWCEPYQPVDKVIVDLSFDLLVHCDSAKSCVAWAELQGGQYNFILGDEELVYVGRGYQCGGGGVLRLQMLITRYTWDPSQPVYRVPNEVVLRYGEVIEEGLRCGKISPHYTVNVTCGVYGPWCGAANIRDQFPWTATSSLALSRDLRLSPWYEPPLQYDHPYLAFDVDRVYDRQHALFACNRTLLGM